MKRKEAMNTPRQSGAYANPWNVMSKTYKRSYSISSSEPRVGNNKRIWADRGKEDTNCKAQS
jgi:hypothetical protein